jgi:ACS family allantoate permease-like MFS transporter
MSLMMGGVDKVILGTAATFGLRQELNLVGQQYSWASSLSELIRSPYEILLDSAVFFGSMLTVFPQTWLCQRLPTGKVGQHAPA